MPRPVLVFLPLLIAGCAAPVHDTREPLPAGRAVEVRYVSRLAPAAAHAPAQAPAQPLVDAAQPPTHPEALAQAAMGPFVRIHCTQYKVDARSLASLMEPNGPRAFGRIAARADVQRVLDARIADGSMHRAARPSILVRDGGKASMSTINHQSYVEGFEITRAGAELIGDPCVATTDEGVSLDVRAWLDPTPSIGVEVELEFTELMRPLLESSVRVPGSGVDVTVQVPLALRQAIASTVLLGPDEVLVLGGLVDRDGAYDLLVVVDARRETGGGGGSAAGRAAP